MFLWPRLHKMDQSSSNDGLTHEIPPSTTDFSSLEEKRDSRTDILPLRLSEESTSPCPSTPLRPGRRLPSSPKTQSPPQSRKGRSSTLGEYEKPPSLSSTDSEGSEDSHVERRFLRQCSELEAHCSGTDRLSLKS